jgi:hypothetical protein
MREGEFMEEQVKQQVVFVLSSGRCGSRSVSAAFEGIEDVVARHEPEPHLMREARTYCVDRKVDGNFELPWAVNTIRNSRHFVKDILKDHHYIESTPALSIFALPLVKVFPEAHLVHLIRDGRNVVRSGMSLAWYIDDPTNAWNPSWWPAPEGCDDRFSKCCWLWAETNRLLADDLKMIPAAQAHTVRLEDLVKVGMRDLSQAIGFPVVERLPHKNAHPLLTTGHTEGAPLEFRDLKPRECAKDYACPHWSEWDQDRILKAKRWMGDELERWGYRWS